MNPTRFRLVVTFRLEADGEDSHKSLGLQHAWDFAKPEEMRFSEMMRALRYALLSIIRTASWASVLGWKAGSREISKATETEYMRASSISRTADPPDDFETGKWIKAG